MNSAEITDDDEVKIPKKNIVKVETENEDEALDCSVTSRSSEKHSVDGAVTCLQDSNKRKQTSLGCDGSGSQQDVLPSVKKRRFTQELRLGAHWETEVPIGLCCPGGLP